MNDQCSIDLLESALAGTLSPRDERTLGAHLETCEECSTSLERLAGGPAWCHHAAALLIGDELDESLPAREEWWDVDFTVEHLEPSDDPSALGRVGPYDILEIVGRGGMGVVLKGFDRELKRCVAIKVLAPHLAQSSLAKKRFAREAQAAAAIVHPNVLAIHQVQPNGRLPFLVMPFVAGESLAQRLAAQGTLELKEILRIGMQAAAGLAAAHEQGLVHRDVKPANILLEKGVERAVLTDFGLARAADDVSITRLGIIAGTPQYMSPEQARGESLDGRSDLFSLGCVLYEMATGVSPFRADSPMATMRRLVDEAPQTLASHNPELPPWFVGIVERLLEKDPSRRFGSAKEVSELLEGCLAHLQQPTGVPLPAAATTLGRVCDPSQQSAAPRARRFRLTTGAVVMIATLGIGLLSFFVLGLADPPDIAGEWTGPEWGKVVLKKVTDKEYTGTYDDTFGRQPGEISLQWSRIEQRFNGTWREGDDRFGEISIRLVGVEIRGANTTDAKSKINPGTPRLADLTWSRPKSNPNAKLEPEDPKGRIYIPRVGLPGMGFGFVERPVLPGVASGAFAHRVPFEEGATHQPDGDGIFIDEVRGTAATFKVGNMYEIKGTYRLTSRAKAMLAAYTTDDGTAPKSQILQDAPTQKTQSISVERGDGRFALILYMWQDGKPHVSLYSENGEGFAHVYFGTGDSVLKKGWWEKDPRNRGADAPTKGSEPAAKKDGLLGPQGLNPKASDIELVALTNFPIRSPWWTTDGKLLAEPPVNGPSLDIRSVVDPKHKWYAALFHIPGFDMEVNGDAIRSDAESSFWMGRQFRNKQHFADLAALAIAVPATAEKADVSIQVARGKWTSIATVSGKRLQEQEITTESGTKWRIMDRAGGVRLFVEFPEGNVQARIALRRGNGITFAGGHQEKGQTEAQFQSADLNGGLFILQTRPFEKVVFRDVALSGKPSPNDKSGLERPRILVAARNLFEGTAVWQLDEVMVRFVDDSEMEEYLKNKAKYMPPTGESALMAVLARNVPANAPLLKEHFKNLTLPGSMRIIPLTKGNAATLVGALQRLLPETSGIDVNVVVPGKDSPPPDRKDGKKATGKQVTLVPFEDRLVVMSDEPATLNLVQEMVRLMTMTTPGDVAAPRKVIRFQTNDRIAALAYSVDGKRIALANGNPFIQLAENAKNRLDHWRPAVEILDAETGKILVKLKLTTAEEDAVLAAAKRGPEFEIALAFSPDNKVLAVGTSVGQIKLFNAETGELIRTFNDEQANRADAAAPEKMKAFARGHGSVSWLAFSPDGDLLATCGRSFDHDQLHDPFPDDGKIRLFAVNSGPGRLKVWDLDTGKVKHDLVWHSMATTASFSSDGNLLASAGVRETKPEPSSGVIIWDPKTGANLRHLPNKANAGTHWVVFSPTSKQIAFGSHLWKEPNDYSTSITLANALSGTETNSWQQSIPGIAIPRAFTPDGKCVVVQCGGESIRFLDANTGKMKCEILAAHSSGGARWNDFAIAAQGNKLAVCGADATGAGFVEVWELGAKTK